MPKNIIKLKYFYNEEGAFTICTEDESVIIGYVEDEDLAKLIAAAPETAKQRDELLKACKAALEVSTSMGDKYPYDVSIQLTNAIFKATVK